MPDMTLIDLSKYRLAKAAETLETARRDMNAEDFASANNRAYYCIFHAMRAVIALDGEDYKKHAAVIARFTMNYLKTEILPRDFLCYSTDLKSNLSLAITRFFCYNSSRTLKG